MKKNILFLFSAAIIVLFSCNKAPSITGEWISEDEYRSPETTIFKDDNTFIVIKDNKVKEFDSENKSVTYELDDSHKPAWIDIIVTDKINKEEIMRIKGIYEFLSDNTIRMCINGGKYEVEKSLIRPSEFDKNNTHVLTRK